MINLSPDYKQKILTWKNNIPDMKKHDDSLKWIVLNHNKIYNYIKNNYKNDNTKIGHISVLAGILRSLNVKPRIMRKYNDESNY